jgi:hypothetical protein
MFMATDQEDGRRIAAKNARRVQLDKSLTPTAIARAGGVSDVKTVRTFLNGETWPHLENLGKIEDGLGLRRGTITAWADRDEEFFAEEQRAERPDLSSFSDIEIAEALLYRLRCSVDDRPDA